MQIVRRRGGHLEGNSRPRVVEVDMLNLNLSAFQSQEFQDFMAKNGFGVVWKDGEALVEHMAQSDASMGQALKAAGLAK